VGGLKPSRLLGCRVKVLRWSTCLGVFGGLIKQGGSKVELLLQTVCRAFRHGTLQRPCRKIYILQTRLLAHRSSDSQKLGR